MNDDAYEVLLDGELLKKKFRKLNKTKQGEFTVECIPNELEILRPSFHVGTEKRKPENCKQSI